MNLNTLPVESSTTATFNSPSIEVNTTVENFQTLEELEKEHFYKAMELANNKKTLVAKMLGITIKSVYNKLNKYASL
jgi:transcriptional regulator with PAS, ATPase and Fis domain